MTQAASRSVGLRRFGWGIAVTLMVAAAVAAYVFRPLPLPPSPALASLKPSLEAGAYLARIGNCAACHTAPGEAAYAGGVQFKTQFGTIHSTNITPDPVNGIGAWRFEQFYAAIKHGIGHRGEHLYPAFPYSNFAGMRDDDIASLYVFLRTLPPSPQANRANAMKFPFGYRGLLHFWKRLYHDGHALAPDPARSAEWNRGRYLVSAVAHCGACHTPRGALGGPDPARDLAGGSYADRTARGTYRQWAAVDLTPGANGLGHWNRADFTGYLLHGKNRHAVVHGPMTEVFAATRLLNPADAAAIAAYLDSLVPGSAAGRLFPFGGSDEGAVIFAVHCATCHLPNGRGDPILGVSLRGNPIVQARDPASLINVILYGPQFPPPPFSTGRSNMKPFGKRLSDEDIAALATFLRRNFGNRAGSVSASQVAAQR